MFTASVSDCVKSSCRMEIGWKSLLVFLSHCKNKTIVLLEEFKLIVNNVLVKREGNAPVYTSVPFYCSIKKKKHIFCWGG